MKKIVVFASGTGSNFQAVLHAVQEGKIEGRIAGLIAGKPGIGAIGIAEAAGIPVEVIEPTRYTDPDDFADALLQPLHRWNPDLIVLAGYLFLIPDKVLRAWPDRIINIHPSLLPRYGGKNFYGMRVHQAVIDSGDTESGCTVHLVDEEYDRGPILAQRKVPVLPDDTPATLARRVLREEHRLLPEVIQQLLKSDLTIPATEKNRPLAQLSDSSSTSQSLTLPTSPLTIRRALLSVSDKTGLIPFAKELSERGVELISTGGTAHVLREAGIPVRDVSEITSFPECLDGRVKTLHPAVHGGILARTSLESDLKELKELDITPIELVVVNLYPFKETISREGVTPAEAVEQIDIGGPTMIRAAAKNFAHVCVLTDPSQYDGLLDELREQGAVSFETRRRLAGTAFCHTADYDVAISGYFGNLNGEELPGQWSVSLPQGGSLRYGENPHQPAALYGSPQIWYEPFHGKEPGYNNYLDMDSALRLMSEFQDSEPTVAILKHTVPCGVASDPASLSNAWKKAFLADQTSPFGGVVIVNRPLDRVTAEEIDGIFTEIVMAPSFSEEALELLRQKKNRRLVRILRWPSASEPLLEFRSILGGALLQVSDLSGQPAEEFRTVTRRSPDPDELEDLLFAWKIVRHVKSNGIVYVKNRQTVGIGSGQTSRVGSSRLAVSRAREEGLSLEGSVVASDAFFPFPDGVEAASEAGARAVIQPGGSIRDEEVIETADRLGLAMVFTGRRHFRH